MRANHQAQGAAEIQWTAEQSYPFAYSSALHSSGSLKTVYIGSFTEDAPEGLTTQQLYCVKEIHVCDESRYPQRREYFDLMDFQGDNLREVLARNPNACAVAEHLKTFGRPSKTTYCYVVEPVYTVSAHLFEDCFRYSVAERLDIILQYALGCQQLRQYHMGNCRVVAHRDVKKANGVIQQLPNGKLRIRLIDYATIRLEEETPEASSHTDTHWKRDETLGVGMSPSNTAPEDLKKSKYSVSAKTDVYALGMLLASLFFTSNQTYESPNLLWVYRNGWSDGICDHKQLYKAFQDCETRYESTATWNNTWIEQALEELGIPFQWECLPSQFLLQAIRHSFFSATRINPNQRPELDELIQQLRQLIDLAQQSQVYTPVSLYLIDQNQLDACRATYAECACSAFRQEQEEAQRRGTLPPVALCLSHRRGLEIDTLPADAVHLLSAQPVRTEQELRRLLESCPTANSRGRDMTVHALLKSCVFLENKGDTYALSGRIHLFAPVVPTMAQMHPVAYHNHSYDIQEFCTLMQSKLRVVDALSIRAYPVWASDTSAEDTSWCKRISVSPPPKATAEKPLKKSEKKTTEKPPEPPVKPSDSPVSEPQPLAEEQPFYTHANASYIDLGDGPLFVGKHT